MGIGANTEAFSVVHCALLRPLPYRDPQRLADILDRSGRESRYSKLFDNYADYRAFRATVGFPSWPGWSCGLAAAIGLSRFFRAFLYGIRPYDPLTLPVASGTLLLTAVLAIALPGPRPALTDPMALRID